MEEIMQQYGGEWMGMDPQRWGIPQLCVLTVRRRKSWRGWLALPGSNQLPPIPATAHGTQIRRQDSPSGHRRPGAHRQGGWPPCGPSARRWLAPCRARSAPRRARPALRIARSSLGAPCAPVQRVVRYTPCRAGRARRSGRSTQSSRRTRTSTLADWRRACTPSFTAWSRLNCSMAVRTRSRTSASGTRPPASRSSALMT